MSERAVITGERVTTGAGGFNPTFQRHVAAYALCAGLLPQDVRVLDLGCGAGHSYDRQAPRETVGVDIDPAALAGQDRETHVADMRRLPFADGSFGAVLSVQSLEHVPDGAAVLREVRRVLAPGGVAVFVTPNRLTFGRPDEIIDPYHYVEYDPEQLRALCSGVFDDVEIHGLFGSARYAEFDRREKARMERVLSLDVLGLRRRLPRRTLMWAYDTALRLTRRRATPLTASITVEDFSLGRDDLAQALDVVAVCR
jgi:SAM-dependent methyltransferase